MLMLPGSAFGVWHQPHRGHRALAVPRGGNDGILVVLVAHRSCRVGRVLADLLVGACAKLEHRRTLRGSHGGSPRDGVANGTDANALGAKRGGAFTVRDSEAHGGFRACLQVRGRWERTGHL